MPVPATRTSGAALWWCFATYFKYTWIGMHRLMRRLQRERATRIMEAFHSERPGRRLPRNAPLVLRLSASFLDSPAIKICAIYCLVLTHNYSPGSMRYAWAFHRRAGGFVIRDPPVVIPRLGESFRPLGAKALYNTSARNPSSTMRNPSSADVCAVLRRLVSMVCYAETFSLPMSISFFISVGAGKSPSVYLFICPMYSEPLHIGGPND